MFKSHSSRLRVAFTLVSFLNVRPASAEGSAADALFDEGRAELAKGNYAVACEKLQQSDQLDPAPGTKLNLGECEALRGRIATAYKLFALVEQQLPASDVRLPIARSKREALQPRLAKLRVTLAQQAPRETRVVLEGQALDPRDYGRELLLDPGEHELSVSAPNFATNRLRLVLEEGKTQELQAQPLPATAAPPERSAPGPAPRLNRQQTRRVDLPLPPATHGPSNTKGLVVLGVGISVTVLASVAGILTLQAKGDNDAHCDDTTRSCDSVGRAAAERGRVLGALTSVGLVAGTIGIGLGTYWLVRGDHAPKRSASLTLRSDASKALIELSGTL